MEGVQRNSDGRGRSIERLAEGGVSSRVATKQVKCLTEADEGADYIVKGTSARKSVRRGRMPRESASDARGGSIR